MNCKQTIEEYLEKITEEDIIFISKLYYEKFSQYSEAAFFKVMERMVKDQKLIRLSKGIYAKASGAEIGRSISKLHTNSILNYYFGENNDSGMYIGYRLFQKYGITKADNGLIELYSNITDQETKKVGNVSIKKVKVTLNYDNAKIIEALEIFQNYAIIKELNKVKFELYAKQFTQSYNDESAIKLLMDMKYKKSTIAFMKRVLDIYEVKNTLGRYLNCASKYNVPEIAKI